MSCKKTVIHEFDPCIYPRLLWVVKGGTLEGIQETLDVTCECDADDIGGAVTLPARRKSDNRLGYCVWFPKLGDIRRGDWIAHESSHVAICIFNDIGGNITYEDQEPFAYLVGWVFGCIDTIRKWKEVKHGGDKSESKDTQEGKSQEACEEEKENRNG